jgi:hypothetical protein
MVGLVAYSGVSWPLIPGEVVHRFRRKLSRDSGAMLSSFSPERNRWTTSGMSGHDPGIRVRRALGNLLVGFLLDCSRRKPNASQEVVHAQNQRSPSSQV